MIEWHKKYIKWWQEKINLSDYGLLWLSFLKGVLLTLLIVWLLNCF